MAMIFQSYWDDVMSFRAPKLPPAPPPPPNAEDEASRMGRERDLRKAKTGRRTLSLTGLAGASAPGTPPALSLTPGRATVTGG
jgi:hypothetical protein